MVKVFAVEANDMLGSVTILENEYSPREVKLSGNRNSEERIV